MGRESLRCNSEGGPECSACGDCIRCYGDEICVATTDGKHIWNDVADARAEQAKEAEQTCACRLCGVPLSRQSGARLCGPCWELDSRVRRHPERARAILDDLEREGKGATNG